MQCGILTTAPPPCVERALLAVELGYPRRLPTLARRAGERSAQRLGDLLVKSKVITQDQLTQALAAQRKNGHARLGSVLVKLGFVTDEEVTTFLSRQYGVPAINLSLFELDPQVVKLVPYETAK